jgi:type I restriction enzyme, S subunit
MTTDTIQQTTRTLPKGWRWVRLGDAGKITSGVTLGRHFLNTPTRSVFYLRVANVKDGHLDLSEVYRIEVPESDIEKCRLQYGDLLLTEGGDPDKLGRGTIWENQIPECIHQNHIFRVRLDPGHFYPQFAAAQISSPYGKAYFLAHAKQTTGIATINQKVLANFPLMVPPLPEQRRIAALLNEQLAAVERARAAAQARLEAARALPAALLRQVFESEEARRWPTKALGDVSVIGSGITLGRSFDGIQTRRVPYLRVANVKDGYLDISDVYEIDVPERDIEKCRLQYGDLLLTEGGDPDKLGRGTFWEEQISECIHQNHIFRVRFDLERFSPSFLTAQIGSGYGKAYFLAHAKQTTGIATINQGVLAGFPLMVPPLAVQQCVANRINEQRTIAEQAIAAIKSQLDAINALPAALLWRAFAGEV